jgi:DNA-binding transcriptional MerR regulator
MAYKRNDVAQHFQRGDETIRRWSIEFADYLSSTANSQGRNKSSYTDGDMERLDLIHRMYEKGNSTEDIHLALKNGQKGQFDGFLRNLRVVLNEAQALQLQQLVQRTEEMEREIETLKRRNSELLAENKSIPTLQSKIDDLNQQIGALKYQLSQNKKD